MLPAQVLALTLFPLTLSTLVTARALDRKPALPRPIPTLPPDLTPSRLPSPIPLGSPLPRPQPSPPTPLLLLSLPILSIAPSPTVGALLISAVLGAAPGQPLALRPAVPRSVLAPLPSPITSALSLSKTSITKSASVLLP